MNAFKAVLVLVATCVAASAQLKPQAAAEPRFFNIEDAVQNRVDLSDAELSVLASDDLMRSQIPQDRLSASLTQEGLEAAEVHLCGSGERDLVVIGDGSPYSGANAGPFWIIRDLPTGPKIVFSAIALGLSIDAKRSNKCFNVEAIASTTVEITTTEFHFNGERYVAYHQKTEKLAR